MTIVVIIDGIFRRDIGSGLFNHLVSLFPSGVCGSEGHAFSCKIASDSENLVVIMNLLKEHGLEPWNSPSVSFRKGQNFNFRLDREYSYDDLLQSEWLQLLGKPNAGEIVAERTSDSTPLVIKELAENSVTTSTVDFYAGPLYSVFVRRGTMSLLTSENFRGLDFRKTYLLPHDLSIYDTNDTIERRHGYRYWEIDGSVEISQTVNNIEQDDGQSGLLDRIPWKISKEESFLYRELHIRASDIFRLTPCDAARISGLEFSFGFPGNRPLIVSNRFYRFCKGNNLSAKWIPVRIDS